MVLLSRAEFEAGQPLLDLLPDPAVLVGPDLAVVWRNSGARARYGARAGACHEIVHGRRKPCDQEGEHCPLRAALDGQAPASVLHSHHSASAGESFCRVLAVPVEGGCVLEIHYELSQELIRDDLTGCYRRERWLEIVRRDQALLRRISRPYAVVFLDLDEFKKFNDAFGHLAGDEVLRQLGAALGRAVRASDTVCRWGGEEFVLFLPSTTQQQALLLARRIRLAVRELRVPTESGLQRITASLGVCAAFAALELEEALQKADAALFAAKRAGRDCVVAHEERGTCELLAASGDDTLARRERG